jgi:hypothetical protein
MPRGDDTELGAVIIDQANFFCRDLIVDASLPCCPLRTIECTRDASEMLKFLILDFSQYFCRERVERFGAQIPFPVLAHGDGP